MGFCPLESAKIEQIDLTILEHSDHLLALSMARAGNISPGRGSSSEQLSKGSQFCAFVAGDWFSFWICDNGGGPL